MPQTEAPTGNAPGFFGKLPSHGDFVSRRLPTELLAGLEAWLDAGLQHSRDSLGDGWLQTYLSSPIWCFSASADCCGAQPFAGVLMPSLDRVGRYYSLSHPGALRRGTIGGRDRLGGNRLVRADGGDRAVVPGRRFRLRRVRCGARRRAPAESRQQESGFGDAVPGERTGRGVADPARQAVAAGRCAIQPLVDIRIEDDDGLLPRFSRTAAG